MSREIEISKLRGKIAFYTALGKRKRAAILTDRLQQLVAEELNCETVAEQMERDLADAWQDWPSEAYGDAR